MKADWALIGCGDIAEKSVVPAIQNGQDSSLISVCRADSGKAKSFARKFRVQKWIGDWHESVKDPEINTVYVATPVYLHAEQTIAAAESGKHVLCEKPMALNTAECTKMIDACKANNVKLGIAYYRHFFSPVIRIKEILATGEIGKVVSVQAENFENFNLPPGAPRYWFLKKELSGGGPMMDMGCHRIEVFTHLLGPVMETRAFHENVVFNREVEDITTAHFTYRNGASAVLISAHAAMEPRDTLRIFGSKGSIHVPNLNKGTMEIITANGSRVEKHPNHKNFHQPLIDDFIQAVQKDRNPTVDGKIGKSINVILDEIYGR
ncbi:MAG: Gfo/Idh/MocA family oxidoreductase [Spirochaetaceae bacterium]|nr:Gfo/Idh/MocA family oxidoreductase [Spirochaetaceae bacterium]